MLLSMFFPARPVKEYQQYYVYTGILVCFEIYFRLKLKIVMAGPDNLRLFFIAKLRPGKNKALPD